MRETGSLSITPQEGLTLNTSFSVVFSGWSDTDIPLVYSCGLWDGTNFELLLQSSEETLSLQLPSGNPAKDYNKTLRCRITDRQGAATTIDNELKVRKIFDRIVKDVHVVRASGGLVRWTFQYPIKFAKHLKFQQQVF